VDTRGWHPRDEWWLLAEDDTAHWTDRAHRDEAPKEVIEAERMGNAEISNIMFRGLEGETLALLSARWPVPKLI
jgi:hypothetical protein